MDEATVRSAVAEVLNVTPEELTPETVLQDLPDFDSLVRLSLMVCLSDLTERTFELSSLQRIQTYGDIMALVNETK